VCVLSDYFVLKLTHSFITLIYCKENMMHKQLSSVRCE